MNPLLIRSRGMMRAKPILPPGYTLLTIDGVTTTRTNVEDGTSNSGAVYLNANNGVADLATDSTYYRRVIVGYNGVVFRDY